jgi:hypothetical protein
VAVAGYARSATLTGLRNGTVYRLLVAAVNSAGQGKAVVSRPVRPGVTVPAGPAAITAAPARSGVTVSWRPPISDGGAAIAGYRVTVSGTARAITTGATTRSMTVTGLTAGKSYTFTVAAVNAKGAGPAAAAAPATAGATVAARTVVLSGAALAALTSIGTGGQLVFTSPPAQVTDLRAGEILVAGSSAATPGGLLAQVTSVTTAGTSVTVGTVPASLDQALSAAGFGVSAELTRSQVASFTPARAGVRLAPAGTVLPSALPGAISFSLDTTLYRSANGDKVTVKGDASLSPSMTFDATVTCCVHTAATFTATDTAAASLTFTAQAARHFDASYPLGEIHFDPIAFDVAGVPVVIVPTLAVKLEVNGTVSAGLSAGAGVSVTAGVQAAAKDGHVSARPVRHPDRQRRRRSRPVRHRRRSRRRHPHRLLVASRTARRHHQDPMVDPDRGKRPRP